jgi:hypothetical protein
VSELVATALEDGVLHVTLSRPEKRNALSKALIAAIRATFFEWGTEQALGDRAIAIAFAICHRASSTNRVWWISSPAFWVYFRAKPITSSFAGG